MDDPYQRQKALLASGEYSDLVITCQDKRWNVHKAIICPRSKFFAAAVRFPVGKEKEDGVVDLPEDEPKVVAAMLTYLYINKYWSSNPEGCPKVPHVHFDWKFPDIASRAERLEMHNAITRSSSHALLAFMVEWIPDDFDYRTCRSSCRTLDSGMLICIRDTPAILKAFNEAANIAPRDMDDTVLYYGRGGRLESATLAHANMYIMADKFDIPDLCKLALAHLEWSVMSPPLVGSIVRYLMEATPASDKKIRDLLSKKIYTDMNLFGMRQEVKEILDEYPELGTYALVQQFGAEHSWLPWWGGYQVEGIQTDMDV